MASDEREGTPEEFAAMFGRRQPSEDDEPSTPPEERAEQQPEPEPEGMAAGPNAHLAPFFGESAKGRREAELIARIHGLPQDEKDGSE